MNKKAFIAAALLVLAACTPLAQKNDWKESPYRWKPNTPMAWSRTTERVHPGDISRMPPDPTILPAVEAAAQQNDPFAQYQLAIAYDHGAGDMPKEKIQELFASAFHGFEGLAGDAEATYRLGSYYDEWNRYSEASSPVTEDKKKAFDLYLQSAEAGFAPAQSAVSYAYSVGENVEKNEATSLDWMKKAAAQGDADNQNSLATQYCSAFGCDHETEAIEWYEKAGNQGHLTAQRRLAKMFDDEKNVLYHNPSKAFFWYQKCAMQGDDGCLRSVVSGYEFGNGVPQNDFEAYKWMLVQKAIQQKWEKYEAFGMEMLEEKLTQSQKSQAQSTAGQLFDEIQKNKENYPYFL